MIADTGIGLTLRLKADASQAKKEIKETKSEADSLQKAGGGSDKLTSFLKSAGESLASLNFGSAEKGAASLTDKIGGLGGSLAGMGGPAALAAGAIAGIGAAAVGAGIALFNLAKQASDYGSEIKDAEEKTGLSAETLSALRYAAEQGGKSFEEFQSGITKFTKTIGDAANGSSQAEEKLIRLGIDPKKALTDLDGALSQVLKRIYEMPPGTRQMNAAMDAFGKTGADLIVTVNAMGGDFEKFKEEAKRLGVVLSSEDTRAADDFGDTLVQLKAQAQGVAFQFAKEFMPDITRAMRDVGEWFTRNRDTIRWWGSEVKSEIQTAIDLAEKLAKFWRILVAPDWKSIKEAYNAPTSADIRRQYRNVAGLDGDGGKEGADYSPFPTKKSPGSATGGGDKSKTSAKESLSPRSRAIVEEAGKLGISPIDYATIISFETGGTYSTSIQSTDKKTGKRYTGLIQFGEDEVRKYGVRRGESFAAQLAKASEFLRDRFEAAGKSISGANILDLYRTVLGGNPNASLTKTDSNGTSPLSGVAKMLREHQPGAMNLLGEKNAPKFDLYGTLANERKKDLEERKKANEQIVRDAETRDNRILEIARASAAQDLAITNQLVESRELSENEAAERRREIENNLLLTEKAQLEARLEMTELSAERRAEIEQRLALLITEIAAKAYNDETEAIRRGNALIQKRFEQMQKLDALIEGLNVKIGGRGALTPLERFNEQLADPDVTEAIRRRAAVLGYTAEQLTDILRLVFEGRQAAEGATRDRYAKNTGERQRVVPGQENRDITEEVEDPGFFSPWKDFAKKIKDDPSIRDAKGAMIEFGQLGVDMANQMADALGGAVEMWALYGDSIGKALRKALAAELAHIAGVATVKALYATALGFMRLAEWDLAGAANAFISAGLWAALAGGTALAARAVAGDSFRRQTSGNAVSSGVRSNINQSSNNSGSNDARTITEGRVGRQETTHVIQMRVPQGWFDQKVQTDFSRMGPLRNAVFQLIEEKQ